MGRKTPIRGSEACSNSLELRMGLAPHREVGVRGRLLKKRRG